MRRRATGRPRAQSSCDSGGTSTLTRTARSGRNPPRVRRCAAFSAVRRAADRWNRTGLRRGAQRPASAPSAPCSRSAESCRRRRSGDRRGRQPRRLARSRGARYPRRRCRRFFSPAPPCLRRQTARRGPQYLQIRTPVYASRPGRRHRSRPSHRAMPACRAGSRRAPQPSSARAQSTGSAHFGRSHC